MSARRLEALLGARLSQAVAAHDAAQLDGLADALEEAMEHQRAGLDRALADVGRAVPRPLRPVVRRVIG